jgi:hypothetical protein
MSIDEFFLNYVSSGKAWIIVGSGPSIQIGYPNWKEMAETVLNVVKREYPENEISETKSAFQSANYPKVFHHARQTLGDGRLLQILQDCFNRNRPTFPETIYDYICNWPISVYLTLNYDDEIQNYLAKYKQSFKVYRNSEDEMGHLIPECKEVIFKLHGDLVSMDGLILDSSQYEEIEKAERWNYWRTKMISIFQTQKIIIIGSSLEDPHIAHLLSLAKIGASVVNPICWLTPYIEPNKRKEYLEKQRIRVIPYNNDDGTHKNLLKLIKTYDYFLPKRGIIRPIKREETEKLCTSEEKESNVAAAFFIFNKISSLESFPEKRIQIINASIESILPILVKKKKFTLLEALNLAGWPSDRPIAPSFLTEIKNNLEISGILKAVNDYYVVGDTAEEKAKECKNYFEDLNERFISSMGRRIRQDFPSFSTERSREIAKEIRNCLADYFRKGGLTLSTMLFSEDSSQCAPVHIAKFINDHAVSTYSSSEEQLAFIKTSVEIFLHANSTEKEFLAQLSQGYFAFHALGTYGEVAQEILNNAKKTIWLFDSNLLIEFLSLFSEHNFLLKENISYLYKLKIPMFTTEAIFDEVYEHYNFANNLIKAQSYDNPDIVAAAKGTSPYSKRNSFLEGFVLWRRCGNPNDWNSYLFQQFNQRAPNKDVIRKYLEDNGIQVIGFSDWPGFEPADHNEKEKIVEKIKNRMTNSQMNKEAETEYILDWPSYKKASPEAEAVLIVQKERAGTYHIMSPSDEHSPAWFISNTSLLNLVQNEIITWRPEAFFRFISTIQPIDREQSLEVAFESALWKFAEVGLSIIDEETVRKVFGGVIDQSQLITAEQEQIYEEGLRQKYGESIDSVLSKVPYSDKFLAIIQIQHEMLQREDVKRKEAEEGNKKAIERANKAEKEMKKMEEELSKLKRYQKKIMEKRNNAKRKKRNAESRKKR